MNEHNEFELDEMFAADAADNQFSGAADALKRIADMATVLQTAEDRVRKAEIELEAAEAAHRRVAQQDFPDLLREVGVPEFTLADGRKIVLDEDYACGISEDRAEKAFAWLRENGYGGLVKTELTLGFGKGEEEQVRAVVQAIRSLGRNPQLKDAVHWQTLKSFVKEQKAKTDAAQPFPDELFGVHPVTNTLVGKDGKKPAKLKRTYQKK